MANLFNISNQVQQSWVVGRMFLEQRRVLSNQFLLSPVYIHAASGAWCYHVVQLLQTTDCQKTVHADPIFNEQLHKVYPVHHQSVQHGLLQRAHLSTQTNISMQLWKVL